MKTLLLDRSGAGRKNQKLSCRRDDFVIPTTGEFLMIVEDTNHAVSALQEYTGLKFAPPHQPSILKQLRAAATEHAAFPTEDVPMPPMQDRF